MSTTLFRFSFRTNGALTDATSVALSDAAGSFGVRRTDTGAVLVAAGTPMRRASVGIYELSIVDPAPSLRYEWWVELVAGGTMSHYQYFDDGGGSPPTGHYAAKADIESHYGRDNVALYSNLDNTSTDADDPRIQYWLTEADAWIDRAWSQSAGRDVPISAADVDFPCMTRIAAEWTGAQLYLARAMLDVGPRSESQIDGRMSSHLDHAERALAAAIWSWQQRREAPFGHDARRHVAALFC